MPNLGADGSERFVTIYIPLNPPGVGWVKFLICFMVRVSIRTCVPNLGAVRREIFLTIDNPPEQWIMHYVIQSVAIEVPVFPALLRTSAILGHFCTNNVR